jgi:hypothetical protein
MNFLPFASPLLRHENPALANGEALRASLEALQISTAFYGQYIQYANFIHQTVRDTFLPRLTHMHSPASLLITCVKIS